METTTRRTTTDQALALHRRLAAESLRDDLLVGPDSGVRFNYRAGRFVKSYLSRLPWHDDLCYMQAQGYWMLANCRLATMTGDPHYLELAHAAGRAVLELQHDDGAWEYPNPEWRGRVATAEGTWAAIGLVETFRRTDDERLLEGALLWARCLEERIGFMRAAGGLAVNYFADRRTDAIPNNSAFVLRLLAELADTTGDTGFLDRSRALVGFLAAVQQPSGEVPYSVDGGTGAPHVAHFQCAQYHAFQALDLYRYAWLAGDDRAAEVAARIVGFLLGQTSADGRFPYACGRPHPEVAYHLAVVAAALAAADTHGEAGCRELADIVRARLLTLQQPDGTFAHSRNDYGILSDRRAYPRYLAMILLHLLDSG